MSDIHEHITSGPVTIAEKGEGGSAEKVYFVSGTTSSATACALARAAAPMFLVAGEEQLIRQTVRAEPDGYDCWLVRCSYGPESDEKSKEKPTPGNWSFSFDTTGGRQTITVAPMKHRHWNTDAGEAPDLKGAINWDGQSVKGMEIVVPALKFQIKAYYEPSAVSTTFMREIARKTARTNSDTWLGFEPGELLYFGGQAAGDIPTVAGPKVQPIPVTHFFEASENLADNAALQAAGLTQGKDAGGAAHNAIDKKGWQYLWTKFRKEQNDDNQVVGVPAHCYVHEPYTEMAFGDFFGFGT